MISEKTFITLIKNHKNFLEKIDKFTGDLTKTFSSESIIFLDWPVEYTCDVLKTIIMDIGETEESADWFVWEGIEQIDNGGTVVGEMVDGEWKYFKINSYKDYYKYITKDWSNLEEAEPPKETFETRKIVTLDKIFK